MRLLLVESHCFQSISVSNERFVCCNQRGGLCVARNSPPPREQEPPGAEGCYAEEECQSNDAKNGPE